MAFALEDLAKLVAHLAPPELAEPWDNVGLQVGDPKAAIKRVLVSLEVSPETLAEARRDRAQAMVVHHPLIFQPIKAVTARGRVGDLLTELIRSKIGLIVAHTNLDKSPAGPNHALADALDVEIVDWLRPDARQNEVKLVVFTPIGHERAIVDAIADGGGGMIGQYSHCSFRAPGTGTFFPLEGADPFIGKKGRFEQAEETRLESVVPRAALSSVLNRVLAAHPYDEPAYDIYPLEPGKADAGLGVVGKLKKATTLRQLRAKALKRLRPLLPKAAQATFKQIPTVGDLDRPIERVAICSGSGGSLLETAARSGADCFVTGDFDHHAAVDSRHHGLAALALGHFVSEAMAMPRFAEALKADTQPALSKNQKVEYLVAQSEIGPWAE